MLGQENRQYLVWFALGKDRKNEHENQNTNQASNQDLQGIEKPKTSLKAIQRHRQYEGARLPLRHHARDCPG